MMYHTHGRIHTYDFQPGKRLNIVLSGYVQANETYDGLQRDYKDKELIDDKPENN